MSFSLAPKGESRLVETARGPLEVFIVGDGPPVVCVASLGRSARDFADLATRLASSGYRALLPEPRGIGASELRDEPLTMEGLALDVSRVVSELGGGRATIVGHAFGNRVARMVATTSPEMVESVVLLACGGKVPPAPEINAALMSCFDSSLSAEQHLKAVATAFFAPGNDASVWADGWYADVAAAQGIASASTTRDTWWTAGDADVLIVQPAQDVVAVPDNAYQIKSALGDRATLIVIDQAGHALLPEQPEQVARVLVQWLQARWQH